MLKTIQIVALLQGLFLIMVLLGNRRVYKKAPSYLLLGCIASILLFLLGDDDYNLLFEGKDFFFFDASLFITFFFLLFRRLHLGGHKIEKKDLLFFLPNLIYFLLEMFETVIGEDNVILEVVELLLNATFLTYLSYVVFYTLKFRTKNGLFYFAIPISLLFALGYVEDIFSLISPGTVGIPSSESYYSYFLAVVAFLFYYITFKLIAKPKQFLPAASLKNYQKSNLKPELISQYKEALRHVMEEEKLFKDGGLSIHKVSKHIGIPRQYVSEVLNVHMDTNFQDFVNRYRVQDFVDCLSQERYKNFTILGIANEVGFNSKTTFLSAFRKIHGTTPQAYKKEFLVQSN